MADLEADIEEFILASQQHSDLQALIENESILLMKYIPAERLSDTLIQQHLYASERSGFTWGDAIYVTPAKYPKTTMMYGDVGVVGRWSTTNKRFFNAADMRGVDLYQRWIVTQPSPYRRLTTTVHADDANRTLRNDFRTFFQIDCVYFRPDETCRFYVDEQLDWWLAITSWDSSRSVAHGYSKQIVDLRWCVLSPESFKQVQNGYQALLHPTVTATHSYILGHYLTLDTDVSTAYRTDTVVVCDFK